MLYNVVLASATHQQESAIGMHMLRPPRTFLPPPTWSHAFRSSQSPGFELPTLHSEFPLALYFPYGNLCVSVLLSQFAPSSPSPTASTRRFSSALNWNCLTPVSLISPLNRSVLLKIFRFPNKSDLSSLCLEDSMLVGELMVWFRSSSS